MWPTANTPVFLILGLVPLIILIVQATRHDFMEFLSLKFAGILFLWIGYHFSPWYSYLSGVKWDSFLLVGKYIDKGLLFSSLCMFAYLAGFSIVSGKLSKNYHSINDRPRLIFPKIKDELLIVLAVLSFLMFLINAGGFEEMWRATSSRGEGQFLQRDFWGKIVQIIAVLSNPVQVALACVASIYIMQSKGRIFRQSMGWFGLLVASLKSISFFSRGAGFSFILFSFLSLRLKGKKAIPLAIVSVSIAIYFGAVGLNERGSYYPGLGNFLDAALSTSETSTNKNKSVLPVEVKNPLDAMAPWTRKALASEQEKSSFVVMGPRFLWNLNPLPSEFVPIIPLGRGLSEIMGTYGSTGITTPALAEVYYAFGIFGFLIMIPLGAIYGWFERLTDLRPSVLATSCLIICFVSFPIGLHSSMRAMTRPLVYAFVIIIIGKLITRLKRRKRRKASKMFYNINKINNCTDLNRVPFCSGGEIGNKK